jgi:hypothetical protein
MYTCPLHLQGILSTASAIHARSLCKDLFLECEVLGGTGEMLFFYDESDICISCALLRNEARLRISVLSLLFYAAMATSLPSYSISSLNRVAMNWGLHSNDMCMQVLPVSATLQVCAAAMKFVMLQPYQTARGNALTEASCCLQPMRSEQCGLLGYI